ncbi:ankyrin repeat domain-containing protein [Microlunatus elymi]|uniref:Ankyrin repeat domain-containing protein n=1 Tax=Microlunatus elymi TaxID=2596828 RepID=A0A516PTY9_9ACTN|nr:ankyrin repeat domain-containing protein [Microlunatus elymi]QDP94665.1 ankyrin repeat domain-containing protein [Microlunatus elymi]
MGDPDPGSAADDSTSSNSDAPDGSAPHGSDPGELAGWLFDRARAGESEQLAAHIEAGMPVNLTDARGNTLLMLAAYHGHAGTVRTLIDHGATVDALNERGQTPLAGAVFKGYEDVVRLLVDAGANPRAGTPSAWDTATFFDRPDLLTILKSVDDRSERD